MTIVGQRTLRKALEQKAEALPDKTFLLFEDEQEQAHSYTYRQFDQIVNQTANGLLSLGVTKGDRVNLHLTNCPEFLFFWFAIGKIGAVMVPTNPLSPLDELTYPVQHSESKVSVTQPDLLPTVEALRERCPTIGEVILTGSSKASAGVLPFSEFVEGQADQVAPISVDPLDDAAILYTSGTTSLPKGVLVTHANYIYLSEVVSKLTRLGPEDRHFITLPLYHANAQYYSFMTSLNVGASVALMPRFSASRFMRQADRYHCTVTSLFAAPMRMILAQPPDPTDRQNRLRLVIFAQNITEAQLAEWEERYEAPLLQIYGMTETTGQPLTNPLDDTRDNMSIGRVTLGYECRVVDEQGQDVPTDTPGQLLVRGTPGVTITEGYFKDPKTTAETIRDGWLWTGDIVAVNEEGYFRFVDRAKDMIKRAGENIAAGEVEAVIKQHEAVADAAVIGVPDPMRDEAIKACVILKEGGLATGDEIIAYCAERLSKFRVPEFVEFRSEFPRTSVGKIQKHLLRREEGAER
ncbi:MAG: ATP-dependent acyl-CoA ligase [Dehalococcoidia bacterium]|nr:ATP-dependent acyl-CoA ligase [Dehalococcoidia bacterium]